MLQTVTKQTQQEHVEDSCRISSCPPSSTPKASESVELERLQGVIDKLRADLGKDFHDSIFTLYSMVGS